MKRSWNVLVSFAIVLVGFELPSPAQQTNTLVLRTAPPAAAATMANPLVVPLIVPDPANPGKTKVVQAKVNNLAAIMAGETPTQASVRKANAVAAAINAVLPGSATVTQKPSLVFVPGVGWRAIGPLQGVVSVKGITALGGAAQGASDPTGQRGVGAGFVPGAAMPAPPPRSYKGGMSGKGSGMGYSTGVDGQGNDSLDAFGFFTDDDSTIDIATIFPTLGETDGQILSALAAQFNAMFGPDGFTATYNSTDDTLSLDQPLDLSESLLTANTDSGLDLVPSLLPTPEPRDAVLIAIGLLGLLCLRRRAVSTYGKFFFAPRVPGRDGRRAGRRVRQEDNSHWAGALLGPQ